MVLCGRRGAPQNGAIGRACQRGAVRPQSAPPSIFAVRQHANRPLAHRPSDTRLPEAALRAQARRLQIILFRSIRNTWRTGISPCFASTTTPSSLRNTCTASTFRGCATAARSCIAASLRRTSRTSSAGELRDRFVAPELHIAFATVLSSAASA